MKLWKFSVDREGWYFDGEQLAAPWWILTSVILLPVYYVTLSLHCLVTAAYYREWYYAEDLWNGR